MEQMEKRSRRRTRDLVPQAASQGLSQNEIGCARISMMARSTNAPCKDRIQMRKANRLHLFTFGLQRTAGPYSWVINGRYQLEMRRPLFPRKQTWIGPARAGKLGEFQRFSPGGLFGLSFNFLRMNQAHRSAPMRPRDLNTPHPQRSRASVERAKVVQRDAASEFVN